MTFRHRSETDRRSGNDRRKGTDLKYFLKGGKNSRSWRERRSQMERRAGWVKMSELWCSCSAKEFST